ncbi:MAG: S8 family serine peptidase [Oscillospiraceae bacterium]|jgi:subtilisin family serine protease|nr:S8 family serine peptidase [Oscillospiraceae bacterium]
MCFDIVVIDCGVDIRHPALSSYSDIYCTYLPPHSDKLVPDAIDIFGHGTAVTGIIKAIRPQTTILSLRIFDLLDGNPISSESRLISALQYIDKHIETKVVNISSTIVAPTKMEGLATITRQLTKKGVVLVSTFENDGALTYPAAFEWVIGIASDQFRTPGAGFALTNDPVINIIDSNQRI